MFDVSRHFRTVSFIKKQLDAMALLKMNRFHFHLEDAVGWRLQLDCYPELTRKCAFRRELEHKSPCSLVDEPAGYVPGTVWDEPGCYGGYYTKDQIRDIIAYAAERNITVMRSRIDDSNTPWGTLALPLFCNERGVRYVRIEFDPTTSCLAVQRVRVDRKKYDQPTGSRRFAVSGKKDGVLCTATAICETAIN